MAAPESVHVRVKPGSALARLLRRTPGESGTERLHRLAERLEVFDQTGVEPAADKLENVIKRLQHTLWDDGK